MTAGRVSKGDPSGGVLAARSSWHWPMINGGLIGHRRVPCLPRLPGTGCRTYPPAGSGSDEIICRRLGAPPGQSLRRPRPAAGPATPARLGRAASCGTAVTGSSARHAPANCRCTATRPDKIHGAAQDQLAPAGLHRNRSLNPATGPPGVQACPANPSSSKGSTLATPNRTRQTAQKRGGQGGCMVHYSSGKPWN